MDHAGLQQTVSGKDKEIAELKEEIARLSANFKEQEEETKQASETAINNFKKELEELQAEKEKKAKEAIEMEQGIAKFRAMVKAVTMKSSATQEQYEKLQATHKVETESLTKELRNKSEKIEELEQTIRERNTEIAQLKADLTKA